MSENRVIVFDMDGVLVDVTDSYRETIVQTVRRVGNIEIDRRLINDYKNAGGWNNDWALSQRILRDRGVDVEYDTVVAEFNKLFLGDNGVPGLIERERWIARPGTLENLAARARLAIFTGRMRYEADITLNRYAQGIPFDPIICADDVARAKPDPEGLLIIRQRTQSGDLLYVGDTVDDARAARAAGIPFIGVVAAEHADGDEVRRLLRAEDAIAIVTDINEIELPS